MHGPVSSHAAAEARQGVASLGSQPTVAGHSGDHPPDLETLRATPARPHQILIQGNMRAVGTEYARCGQLNIAYQLVGDGPFDLVFVPSWFSNIEVLWESPMVSRFLDRLASFSRLILFDRR